MLTSLSAAAAAAAGVPFLQLDQPAGCRVAILPAGACISYYT